jgi:hypothetical protein
MQRLKELAARPSTAAQGGTGEQLSRMQLGLGGLLLGLHDELRQRDGSTWVAGRCGIAPAGLNRPARDPCASAAAPPACCPCSLAARHGAGPLPHGLAGGCRPAASNS